MKEKNIEYYINLPYRIEIYAIPPEEGGGYTARLPQFGSNSIVGDGETIPEAIESLENIKKYIFKLLIEKGSEIPEPDTDILQYSGKFLIRIPKELHAKITYDAKINNISINQLVTYRLSSKSSMDLNYIVEALGAKIDTCFKKLPEEIYNKTQNDSKKLNDGMQKFIFAADYHRAA